MFLLFIASFILIKSRLIIAEDSGLISLEVDGETSYLEYSTPEKCLTAIKDKLPKKVTSLLFKYC